MATTTTNLSANAPPPSYLAATSRCNYCSAPGNDDMISCAECKALCHRACAGFNEATTAPECDWKCKACNTTTPTLAGGMEYLDCAFELGRMVGHTVPELNLARMAIGSAQPTEDDLAPITEAPGFNFFKPGENSECIVNVPVASVNNDVNDDCDNCCCNCDGGDSDSDGDCGCCDSDSGDCDCGDCCIQ